MEDEVMTIKGVAEYLQISPDSAYQYASSGTLPGFKLGNRWRFKKSIVDAWMIQQSNVMPCGHPVQYKTPKGCSVCLVKSGIVKEAESSYNTGTRI